MAVINDQEILRLLKKDGKREYAFNLILEKYKQKLYKHLRRILINHEDTDDVLQDTFVKVWFAIDTFREDSSLYTWLYRIATNEAISLLRKNKRISFFSLSENIKGLENQLMDNSYFDSDKTELKLQKAILSLPEKQRIVFNMRYYEEIKYEEMESILGTSSGAIKASYHHAVKKITKLMELD